jgi:hypothetical protein
VVQALQQTHHHRIHYQYAQQQQNRLVPEQLLEIQPHAPRFNQQPPENKPDKQFKPFPSNLHQFTVIYLTAAILTRTFNTQDINNLREMFTALGPLQQYSVKS